MPDLDAHPAASPPDTIVGFDGSLDDTSLVVMHRGHDGTWRVESTDGPDAADLARMVTGAVERHRDAPPGLAGQVTAWLAAHAAGTPFERDDAQREFLARTEPAIREPGAQICR